jgi:hypothetical protein
MGVCSCPDNFEQIGGIGPCVPKCSPTQERIAGVCRELCRDGKTRNPKNGDCWCDPSQTFELGGKCISNCSPTEERIGGQGPCVPKCGPTQERINGRCVDNCLPGQYRDSDGNCIIKCRPDQELSPDKKSCRCKPGFEEDPVTKQCFKPPTCGPNQELTPDRKACKCKTGYIEDSPGLCVPVCPVGQKLSADKTKCEAKKQISNLPIRITAPVHLGGFLQSTQENNGALQTTKRPQDIRNNVTIEISRLGGFVKFVTGDKTRILVREPDFWANKNDVAMPISPYANAKAKRKLHNGIGSYGENNWPLDISDVKIGTITKSLADLAKLANINKEGFIENQQAIFIYFKNHGFKGQQERIPPPVIISFNTTTFDSYDTSGPEGQKHKINPESSIELMLEYIRGATKTGIGELKIGKNVSILGGKRKTMKYRRLRYKKTIKHRKSSNKKTKKHRRK